MVDENTNTNTNVGTETTTPPATTTPPTTTTETTTVTPPETTTVVTPPATTTPPVQTPESDNDIEAYMKGLEQQMELDRKAERDKLKSDMDDKIANQNILENPRLKDLMKGVMKKQQDSEAVLLKKIDDMQKILDNTSAGSKSPDTTTDSNPYDKPPEKKSKSGRPTIDQIEKSFMKQFS